MLFAIGNKIFLLWTSMDYELMPGRWELIYLYHVHFVALKMLLVVIKLPNSICVDYLIKSPPEPEILQVNYMLCEKIFLFIWSVFIAL